MERLRLRRRIAGVVIAASCLAGLTLVVGTPTVHAYPPVNDVLTVTASCTTTTAGHTCTVTATLTDPNGNPVANITIQWTVSGTTANTTAFHPGAAAQHNALTASPACGSVNPTSGVTDAQGQTTTTFTPGDTCCTSTRITATAPSVNASGSTVIDVTCGGVLGISTGAPAGGLPNTSGSPGRPGVPLWAAGLLIAGLLTTVGGGVFLSRSRRQTQVP